LCCGSSGYQRDAASAVVTQLRNVVSSTTIAGQGYGAEAQRGECQDGDGSSAVECSSSGTTTTAHALVVGNSTDLGCWVYT